MKRQWSMAVVAICVVLAGCGPAEGQIDQNQKKLSEQYATKRAEIMNRAKRVPWDQVSKADKDEFVQTFGGDAVEAKMFWNDIVSPPGPGTRMPNRTP